MLLFEVLLDGLENIVCSLLWLAEEGRMASLNRLGILETTGTVNHHALHRTSVSYRRRRSLDAKTHLYWRQESMIFLADKVGAWDILPGLVPAWLSEGAACCANSVSI